MATNNNIDTFKPKVNKDIPYPVPLKYLFPFAEMKVGDSFEVPKNKKILCKNACLAFRYQHSLKLIRIARNKGRIQEMAIHKKFQFRRIDDDTLMCFRVR